LNTKAINDRAERLRSFYGLAPGAPRNPR
jgi:hypothetical protein